MEKTQLHWKLTFKINQVYTTMIPPTPTKDVGDHDHVMEHLNVLVTPASLRTHPGVLTPSLFCCGQEGHLIKGENISSSG